MLHRTLDRLNKFMPMLREQLKSWRRNSREDAGIEKHIRFITAYLQGLNNRSRQRAEGTDPPQETPQHYSRNSNRSHGADYPRSLYRRRRKS